MKNNATLLTKLSVMSFIFVTIFLSACDVINNSPPTKTLMEGVWTVTHVYDTAGVDHVDQLKFPVTALSLSSDNTVIASASPMIMFIVYGGNKYTQIASDIDQVFNYANLSFNGGEYFVGDGVVDNFTIEMKLEGLPGQHAMTELLTMLGINSSFLNVVIYHKFQNVGIHFTDADNTMTWTIDDQTTAVYNTKDKYGNYVLWGGWPVNKFTRCTIVLAKQVKTLTQVVTDAK
jgi:hypothetical protein